MTDPQVVIIGGGAAGIAAARHLHRAQVPYRLLEARPRLGGRAFTIATPGQGFAVDLGCGWLHSADRNPWSDIAVAAQLALDKTPPPWMRPSSQIGFPLARQQDYRKAVQAFYARLDTIAAQDGDVPVSAYLPPSEPWSALMGAVVTYISGAEPDKVSAIDLQRYDDTEVNWRVVEGYGHLIASHGAGLHATLDCPATAIDARGPRLRVETASGAIECDRVILTIPTALIARGAIRFLPDLPAKREAAAHLPLGLNDKLFLSLAGAEEFEADSRLFGRTDTTATAAYHMRPFGRPQIEVYFGGALAHDLERAGADGFFDFARSELVALLGGDFARRIQPVALHRWGSDVFAGGAYSYATPGHADARAILAAPVDDRILFAGEACSAHDFSTAHGAYLTGIDAAQAIVAAQRTG